MPTNTRDELIQARERRYWCLVRDTLALQRNDLLTRQESVLGTELESRRAMIHDLRRVWRGPDSWWFRLDRIRHIASRAGVATIIDFILALREFGHERVGAFLDSRLAEMGLPALTDTEKEQLQVFHDWARALTGEQLVQINRRVPWVDERLAGAARRVSPQNNNQIEPGYDSLASWGHSAWADLIASHGSLTDAEPTRDGLVHRAPHIVSTEWAFRIRMQEDLRSIWPSVVSSRERLASIQTVMYLTGYQTIFQLVRNMHTTHPLDAVIFDLNNCLEMMGLQRLSPEERRRLGEFDQWVLGLSAEDLRGVQRGAAILIRGGLGQLCNRLTASLARSWAEDVGQSIFNDDNESVGSQDSEMTDFTTPDGECLDRLDAESVDSDWDTDSSMGYSSDGSGSASRSTTPVRHLLEDDDTDNGSPSADDSGPEI